MALSVSGLQTAMMSATYNYSNYTTPMTMLGNAIRDYIIANADLSFSWTATNTVDPYDTETQTPSGEILTCPIVLTPSYASVPVTGLTYLATGIVAGIRLGTFNITTGGYSTTAQLMSDCPDFTLSINFTNSQTSALVELGFETVEALYANGSDSNRQAFCASLRTDAFLQLSEQIINQITAYHPGTPIPGTRGTYQGATTLCTIA